MKKIITIAALLIAFTAAHAQTNETASTDKKTNEATKPVDKKDTQAPAAKDATASYDDDSSQYVGTNDFYLKMIREGVKKG
jgi:hypothetical protein